MEKGDKYLSGVLDLGALGKEKIVVFKNVDKEKEKQPDHRIFRKDGDSLKECGVLWVNEKKGEEKQKNVKGDTIYG
ncbi:MAG: hypothetical protein ABEK36_04570 [Candidatus Aenigmatarchaeota archaeon]